jgi:parvulin-like peptidyl-prolyl isomerase
MSASTERKNRIAAREAGTDKKLNASQEAAKKAAASKRNWTIGIIAVVLFVALIFFLSSPVMYRITTARTIGEKSWSPAEIRCVRGNLMNEVYANPMIQQYMSFGLIDEQYVQSLVNEELENRLAQYSVLLQYAEENGIELTKAEKDAAADTANKLPDIAANYELSVDEYMTRLYGKGVNLKVVRQCAEMEILCNKVQYAYAAEQDFTQEQLDEYYNDPAHEFNDTTYSYALYQIAESETLPAEDLKYTAEAIRDTYNDTKDDGEDVEPLDRLNNILAEELGPDAKALVHYDEAPDAIPLGVRDWVTAENREPGAVFAGQSTEGAGWFIVMYLDRTNANIDVARVRGIFISVTEERDDAAAKARAEELLNAWNEGDQSEADYATLAFLFSEDSEHSASGGLYSSLKPGAYGDEVDAFCFAEKAKGDTAIVAGELNDVQGYFVLYYIGTESARNAAARATLTGEAVSNWITEITKDVEVVNRWGSKLV